MRKMRMTALLLCAALLAPLSANAATTGLGVLDPSEIRSRGAALFLPAAEETAPEAEDALRFLDLREKLLENYYPLLTLGESIQTLEEWDYERTESELRDQLNETARQQHAANSGSSARLAPLNAMISAGLSEDPANVALLASQAALQASAATGSALSSMLSQQLQMQYDAYEEAYDKVREGKLQADNEGVKRQLRNLQDQTVLVAESLFITCKGLAAQDAALTRTVASLERTEREMRLRSELGQVSVLTVQQVDAGLAQARSGQKTLRMNLDNILLQLKAMCGVPLDQTLTIGALPQVTAAQLDAMELEADLARAQEKSYELYDAKKTCDDAKEAYEDAKDEYGERSKKNEWMQAKHTWQAAQYTYENAKQSYELRFRTLFAQVKDAAQALDAKRAAVTAQERLYAAEALRYEQGTISANALANAEDELARVRDEAASALRDLYAQYRTYENAVTYGILNS